ncbi:MAG: M56 family metallopeptidase [Bacteroidales bacterium]|nr:M56 family metallopeptidase [Bacteroidales bacterium]
MSPFLIYIGRAGLYLSLFYAFYLLVMRRTTFFRLNRALLLLGSYLCLLLPLIRLRTVTPATVFVSELTMAAAEAGEPEAVASAFPWSELLVALYLTGALVALAFFALSSWKMGRLIRSGEQTRREGCRLVLLDQDVPSFSWGRIVVMSRKDMAGNPAIFTHERMHVQYRHSLDLLLFLPLQILFWWNPLVWITREELRLLHEFQADEGVIQNGIDATQYQLLLVRKAVGEQRFTLASGFQHAKLKNRITMMLKPTSSAWMRWSYLALIPVMMLVMYACNNPRNNKKAEAREEAVEYSVVETKPSFNGGDANQFAVWVNSQLNYPEQAKTDGAQGRVMVQFTIGADGDVRDAVVLRGVREDLDAEALRVVSASPKWEPGYNADGKAVPVLFNIPIVYKLQ